jgi:DNA-binding NarL/FixJ family response regulator
VDDHRVIADGIALLLERDPTIVVAGVAGNGAEAVEMVERHQPDLVLMDFRLPGENGAEVATRIKSSHPDIAVLFLSADDTDGAMLAAVKAGASGYLDKSESSSRLVDAVHRVAAGEMLVPAATVARLMSDQERRRSGQPDLTRRQAEILELMAVGLGTRAIAEELELKPSTAAWHVQAVLEKLGAHSRLEAVAQASRLGLLKR